MVNCERVRLIFEQDDSSLRSLSGHSGYSHGRSLSSVSRATANRWMTRAREVINQFPRNRSAFRSKRTSNSWQVWLDRSKMTQGEHWRTRGLRDSAGARGGRRRAGLLVRSTPRPRRAVGADRLTILRCQDLCCAEWRLVVRFRFLSRNGGDDRWRGDVREAAACRSGVSEPPAHLKFREEILIRCRIYEDYGSVVMVQLESPRGISRFPVDRNNIQCRVEQPGSLVGS
jgi:hypothetical protein